jgi:hypothetical protein
MSPYIQNYGFTKTLFQDNNNNRLHNEIKWQGNYDGKMANIDLDVNDNGVQKLVNIQLDNNDIKHLFGVQPVEESLEKRLVKDFLYKPMTLTLVKQKSRRRRKSTRKSRKSRKNAKNKKTKKILLRIN